MQSKKTLALVVASLLSSITGVAGAQTKAAKQEPIFYRFDDDAMLGDTLSSNLAVLRVRPAAGHVTLLRPRASFVVEMLKSVEGM
jgi:hypothetical protein